MCGIFGSLGVDLQHIDSIFSELQDVLHHRGPDDRGFKSGKNFAFGFTRLAILDLTDLGSQPMFDSSNRFCIIFNGEIFNYRELQHKYLDPDHLKSSSDTEILLQMLMLKGENAIPLLNGMFAFCFLDTQTGKFILARDRFGIKPLYFSIQNNTLSFASELSALKLLLNSHIEVDEYSLLEYLGIGYISGSRAIFKNTNKLKPASYLTGNIFSKSLNLEQRVYWTLDYSVDLYKDYELAIEEFEEIFGDSVSIRLRSDVPLGVFLSGGIDSGLVAAFAAMKQDVICYNVGFEDKRFDESDAARITADHIGASLKYLELQEIGIEKIQRLGGRYDEPFADSSALPSYEVCKAGAKVAKVFLTGDAGDEAFAGYNRYIKRLKYNLVHNWNGLQKYASPIQKWVPSKFLSEFDKLTSEPAIRDAYYDNIPTSILSHGLLKKGYHNKFEELFQERVYGFYKSKDITLNQQLFDYDHYLPNDILVKMDRASMSNSIEVRSPFLDYRIHEFACKLPRSWLLDRNTGKKFLRDVAKKYLPLTIHNRKKMGFGIPVNKWTREKSFLKDLSNAAKSSHVLTEYIDLRKFQAVKDAHKSSKLNAGWIIWNIAMLLSWEKENLENNNGGLLKRRIGQS